VAEHRTVSVLLDTCALVALAAGELPDAAAAALRKAPDAYVSVVSPWEVAIKVAGGKLRLLEPPDRWFLGLVERYDLREVPLDAVVACAAAALPLLHRDPFDRVIVALARAHRLTVLTSDENIRKYPGVITLW
jgi:PIN domain nuclease of toxin-antitoxin system